MSDTTDRMEQLRKNPQYLWLQDEVAATQKALKLLLEREADRTDDVAIKRRLLDAAKELHAENAPPRRPK